MQITTFDFHNTLAHCDPWFELEIRELPSSVLTMLARRQGSRPDALLQAEATARYRSLRRQIMDSGIEQDAQACVEQVFEEIGHPVDTEAIREAIEQLMRDTMRHLTPVPGAIETVSAIIDSGTPVGIVSSAVYHPFLEWALAAFGVRDRLAFVATSASIGYYKSDIRIYHSAYQQVGAIPEMGVHVGDSPRWDVAVAREAGLGTVLYAAKAPRPSEMSDGVQADLVLTSLVDAHEPILKLLREREAGAVRS